MNLQAGRTRLHGVGHENVVDAHCGRGSLFQRNIGAPDDQTAQFTPHKIIGNLYYVGTKSLSAFLVVTPQGNILNNTTYERNVPTIQKSVEQLGFKFSDTKILLGSHAHGDHQGGDAMVKQVTGAQVMAMAEDVPGAAGHEGPGGKEHRSTGFCTMGSPSRSAARRSSRI